MEFISKSVNDTMKIGRRLSANLKLGDIVCLFGKLGSGKTMLTKGIASGLGIKDNLVTSPSFVLIRQYERARLPLYHFDLYRLKGIADIIGLGYEEYLFDFGVSVIEWADRLTKIIPKEYLKVELSVKDKNKRLLKFTGIGRRGKELLKTIHEPRPSDSRGLGHKGGRAG